MFAEQFVAELQPKTVEDVENGLKSVFGPIFESMLKGELSAHLGYESNDHKPKDTTNRRNGSTKKHAVYCIVAYDLDGRKDILGLWVDESENKHQWMLLYLFFWTTK